MINIPSSPTVFSKYTKQAEASLEAWKMTTWKMFIYVHEFKLKAHLKRNTKKKKKRKDKGQRQRKAHRRRQSQGSKINLHESRLITCRKHMSNFISNRTQRVFSVHVAAALPSWKLERE
ncbi:hypothetical protein TorRG33x02_264800 [Trema orientale]|uniref:Uncharacterized protein n=1 Tax=Trema orientale TaxID=63057 RepID=A0A2P5D1Z4_TREOI|nr:hypothetical protein TorRG33x02_264800 [Trema orientale]